MRICRALPLVMGLTAIAVMLGPPYGQSANQAKDNNAVQTDLQGDPLPPGAVSRFGTVRLRQPGTGGTLVFSQDGRRIVSQCYTGEVLVWDVATGKLHSQLPGRPLSGCKCLAFSSDGKFLAASKGTTIHVWDVAAAKELSVLEGHRGDVCGLAFAPDGWTLASIANDTEMVEGTTKDRTIRVWDVPTAKLTKTLTDQPARLSSVAFLADGKRLALGDAYGGAYVLNIESNKVEKQLTKIGTAITELRPGPDGSTLTAIGHGSRGSREFVSWDLTTGKLRPRDNVSPQVTAFAFSPDGKHLAICCGSVIYLRNAAGDKDLQTLTSNGSSLTSRGSSFASMAFSPDGKRLVATVGPRIMIWDTSTGQELHGKYGHSGAVTSARFLPDSKTVLSYGWEGTLQLWDAATGKPLRDWHLGYDCFAFSPDGKTWARGSEKGTLSLWDVGQLGPTVAVLGGAGQRGGFGGGFGGMAISALAFAPDAKTMAVSTQFGPFAQGVLSYDLNLVDAVTGKDLHNFARNTRGIVNLVFSPDGTKLLFSESTNPFLGTSELHLWDVAACKELDLPKLPDTAQAQFFSADSKSFGLSIIVDGTNRLTLWSAETRKPIRDFPMPGYEHFAGLAPDGKVIAMAPSSGGTVRLRDLISGRKLAQLEGHRGWVYKVAFAADGKYAVSGCDDSTALVWDLPALLKRKRVPAPLKAGELERLWTDLGSKDWSTAIDAVDRLVEFPDDALALLKQRVAPFPSRVWTG